MEITVTGTFKLTFDSLDYENFHPTTYARRQWSESDFAKFCIRQAVDYVEIGNFDAIKDMYFEAQDNETLKKFDRNGQEVIEQ